MIVKTPSFELAIYTKGNVNAKKVALVLPGKLDSKDYAHMKSHVDFLADKGYYSVSFDPPGTWESLGDISLYTMTNYLKAINELIQYLGNKPTFLMGHSRGSTMSIIGSNTNSNVVGFASIMCSVTPGAYTNGVANNWKELGYKDEYRDTPTSDDGRPNHYMLPYSFFEDQKKYDLEKGLRESTKPKLFIYGKFDTLATPEKVKILYDLSKDPKEIYELQSDHKYSKDVKYINEVNDIVAKFIDKNKL